jgi:putative DNA primase/helicase
MTGAVVADFISAMESAGMGPAEPIADKLLAGGLVRFQCGDDRKGRRNGWAVLHLDGIPAGAFGSYRMGLSSTWRANTGTKLSAADRLALKRKALAEREVRAAEAERMHREVAAACVGRWERSGPVDPAHPYLVRKRISGEGLRQIGARLLVPMRDASNALWNVQTILPDGTKLFAKGGRQSGLHLVVGEPTETVVIGEGYSTCAVVRRATGNMVVVAFSAGNLSDVALAIRGKFPGADIIIAADDDAHLVAHPHVKKNIGIEKAKEAARAVSGRVAFPPRGV